MTCQQLEQMPLFLFVLFFMSLVPTISIDICCFACHALVNLCVCVCACVYVCAFYRAMQSHC